MKIYQRSVNGILNLEFLTQRVYDVFIYKDDLSKILKG